MEHEPDPALSGRVAVVTGANSGIGRVTAHELAARGMRLFITCRSRAKGEPVVEEIVERSGNPEVECLAMELGDFDSVRRCAEDFLARDLPLHLLVNNAGLGVQNGRTPSGFELAFGVNHLGPFLFTTLLLERIVGSAPARIVTVASVGHANAKGIDFEAVCRKTASYYGSNEYYVSKLANLLFSAELARRLAGTGVTTYSLHPGIVATNVWRRFRWPLDAIAKAFMMSEEDGARTTLYCATSPEVEKQTGLYYDSCAVKEPSALARDPALARELWERSEEWVGYRHSFD
ncbi:MAG: SDR family oxidoreductase [Deltaproteobacteria bacterium]|jgi:NAD(P)-dependent dehydrogenase (short-subunit alcohol dehydrogenase family)|nr:SDR family oxidoreductase [Deltaproteobacteria bacterium]